MLQIWSKPKFCSLIELNDTEKGVLTKISDRAAQSAHMHSPILFTYDMLYPLTLVV